MSISKQYTKTPTKQEMVNPEQSFSPSDLITEKKTGILPESNIENDFWKSKWQDLNALYSIQQDKIKTLQQLNDSTSINAIENNYLKTQLENANNSISQLNKENFDLRTQLISASGLKDKEEYNKLLEDKIHNQNLQIIRLNEQLKEETLEHTSAQRNLQATQSQLDTVKSLTDMQLGEIQQLRRQNEQLIIENSQLQKQIKHLQSSHDLQNLQSSMWQNRATSLEREKYDLQVKNTEIPQLTVQKNRLELETKVQGNKIDQQNQIITKLYGQLNNSESQKQNLQRSLRSKEIESMVNNDRANNLEKSLSIERGRSQTIIQHKDRVIGDISRERMRVEREKILKTEEARQKSIEASIWRDQARRIEIQKNAQILSEQDLRMRQKQDAEISQYIQAQNYTNQLNGMNYLLTHKTIENENLRRSLPTIVTYPAYYPVQTIPSQIVYY